MSEEKVAPADFCILDVDPASRLSRFERLTLVGGRELERALAWLSAQFTGFNYYNEFADFRLELLREATEYYSQSPWPAHPDSFFRRIPAVPAVRESRVHGLEDGEVVDLEFPSSYSCHHSAFREERARFPENFAVHARMWRHRKQARGTIIAIHGWMMEDPRVNALAFQPGYFYKHGMGCCFGSASLPWT